MRQDACQRVKRFQKSENLTTITSLLSQSLFPEVGVPTRRIWQSICYRLRACLLCLRLRLFLLLFLLVLCHKLDQNVESSDHVSVGHERAALATEQQTATQVHVDVATARTRLAGPFL